MRTGSPKLFLVAVALAAFAVGCATGPSRKQVLQKAGDPQYRGPLSAEEMEIVGKNIYSIPAATYAFLGSEFVPAETNILGITSDRTPKGVRWIPRNLPYWAIVKPDNLYALHDCVRVERLFTIPWGWNAGEVGLKESDLGRKTITGHQDQRFVPYDIWIQPGLTLTVWDNWLKRLMTLDYSGKMISVESQDSLPKDIVAKQDQIYRSLEKECQSKIGHFPPSVQMEIGKHWVYHFFGSGNIFDVWAAQDSGGTLVVCDTTNGSIGCSINLPANNICYYGTPDGKGWTSADGLGIYQVLQNEGAPGSCHQISGLTAKVDQDGNVIYFSIDDSGIEVFRYRIKQ